MNMPLPKLSKHQPPSILPESSCFEKEEARSFYRWKPGESRLMGRDTSLSEAIGGPKAITGLIGKFARAA
ncbi:hypothetical protein A8A54_20395 [Brucella pseudogrignonensis]|nr:hypothetical protein A8A54_20395 [Brucella pseudogrignonensis]